MCSLLLYAIAYSIAISTPPHTFTDPASPIPWLFIMLALLGAITGNLRSIALTTLVTILIPEETRAQANGVEYPFDMGQKLVEVAQAASIQSVILSSEHLHILSLFFCYATLNHSAVSYAADA